MFIAIFLLGVPSGSLQSIFSQFAKDTFKWEPVIIGIVFSILGAVDILTQSLVMPRLLRKLKVARIAVLGMVSEIIGFGLMAASALFTTFPFFIAGTIIFGFGDAIFGPAVNGIASSAVSSEEQGRVQGGSQSIQALTRIIGPILGGALYASLGHFAPAVMGMILVGAAIAAMHRGSQV
jgi:DHA1 family tetracycline resistance protein-like MFS transporter